MAWTRLCRGRRTQGRPGVAREARTALDQESKQRRRGSAWLLWRVRLKPVLGSARGRDDQHRGRHTRPAHGASDHRALVHIPGVRLLRHPRRCAAAPQTKRMTQRVAVDRVAVPPKPDGVSKEAGESIRLASSPTASSGFEINTDDGDHAVSCRRKRVKVGGLGHSICGKPMKRTSVVVDSPARTCTVRRVPPWVCRCGSGVMR